MAFICETVSEGKGKGDARSAKILLSVCVIEYYITICNVYIIYNINNVSSLINVYIHLDICI